MKKKILIIGSLALLVLGACKPEMEANEVNSAIEVKKADGATIHKLIINGKSTYVNEVDGVYHLSNDVTISPEQFNYLKKMAISGTATVERSTIARSFAMTWPDGTVYYNVSNIKTDNSTLSAADYEIFKKTVDSAINKISSRTSIQFVEREGQTEFLDLKVSTRNRSPYGRTQGSSNAVEILNYNNTGNIIHQIMHSLGINHEQSRPDRDLYISINTSGLATEDINNFNIDPTMAAYGAFDYGSIMMYQPSDLSRPISDAYGRPTFTSVITRLDNNPFVPQRTELSAVDYAGINQLYGPANTAPVLTFNIATASGRNIASNANPINVDSTQVVIGDGVVPVRERFVLHKTSSRGSYIIRSAEDATKVLTATGTASGSAVELRRNKNLASQKWILENLGNQGYTLSPESANTLRLEVQNDSTQAGTRLIVATVNETVPARGEIIQRQRFRLNPINN